MLDLASTITLNCCKLDRYHGYKFVIQ